jgi:two-component system, LytTR family, response regulator
MIKAIIIDDMPQAITLLQHDLSEFCPEIQVIGTANSVVSGAKLLKQTSPDLVFLDILLGDGLGFDILEIVGSINSKIIFVTASDEFAVRAFRFSAIDYLLKPIDSEQLKQAVLRAKLQLKTSRESIDLLKETIRNPEKLPTRISLHSQEKIAVVDIDQIIRCESDDNNTKFFLRGGETIFVTRTLRQFEELLKEHPFIRVHQSHLVSVGQIHEFVKRDGGYLKLKNGDLVPVSVRKKAEVLQLFETF